MSQPPNDSSTSKLLSVAAHGAALFTSFLVSIVGPIAILAASDDSIVKANARESLNFQLSMMVYALIGFVLSFVGVGIILLFVLVIWSVIAPIVAMIKVADNPSVPYRYSMIMHFLK